MLTPFDLHVLSTPPAFILSQDQTLLFWFAFPPGFPRFLKAFYKTEIFRSYSKLNLAFPFLLLLLGLFRSFFFFLWNHSAVFTACFTTRCFHTLRSAYGSDSFGIFSGLHYCLFVKVLFFFVLHPRLSFFLSAATALLSYHVLFTLSSTFFYFFTFFLYKISSHRSSGGILI